jgi:plastocyanin
MSLAACGGSPREDFSRADSLSSVEPAVDAADGGATTTDASTGADASTGDASTGVVVQVLVKRSSYAPAELTIHRGDTVRWVWDAGRHNVVSGTVAGDQGTADGKFCNPGGATCADAPLHGPPFTYEHMFADVGDYPYFCTPHISMGMVATIHVVP